jgi:hypothetical protein
VKKIAQKGFVVSPYLGTKPWKQPALPEEITYLFINLQLPQEEFQEDAIDQANLLRLLSEPCLSRKVEVKAWCTQL